MVSSSARTDSGGGDPALFNVDPAAIPFDARFPLYFTGTLKGATCGPDKMIQ